MAQMEYSRPFTIAPGTPKDGLAILRRAFRTALADTDYLAQAAKLKPTFNMFPARTAKNGRRGALDLAQDERRAKILVAGKMK
jgi:hypothetical protein